jgi:hypothetical protein
VHSIGLHVRGDDIAAGIAADIISHLGLLALDTSEGDFFDPATAARSSEPAEMASLPRLDRQPSQPPVTILIIQAKPAACRISKAPRRTA